MDKQLQQNLVGENLPSVLGPTSDTQAFRPYPQFSNVSIQSPTIGESNYYAGMVRIEKRYSHGFNFGASYTFSKFLDNTDEVGSTLGNNNGPYSNITITGGPTTVLPPTM